MNFQADQVSIVKTLPRILCKTALLEIFLLQSYSLFVVPHFSNIYIFRIILLLFPDENKKKTKPIKPPNTNANLRHLK